MSKYKLYFEISELLENYFKSIKRCNENKDYLKQIQIILQNEFEESSQEILNELKEVKK